MGLFLKKTICPAGLRSHLIKALLLLHVSFLLFAGCKAKPLMVRPDLQGEGDLVVYLQPLSQESDNLTFTLEGISAVREDGDEFPLPLSFNQVKGIELKRQRLLAYGDLPPGKYSGILLRVKDAYLKGEEGNAALLVPDEPVLIDSPFEIRKEKSLLLSLVFNYASSIQPGYAFVPSFSLFVPDRPVIGLVGYVANYDSNNITVFDKQRGEAVYMIATGRGPRGIAIDPTARRAYVALSEEHAVDVIDVLAGDRINRIRLVSGDYPQEPALTPDGTILLTANRGSDTVSVIDTFSMIELERIFVEDGPHSVAIDPAGKRAFVFNTYSSTISVIDMANRSLVTILSTEAGPFRGEFNRRGDRLYVIHEGSSYLTVIDPMSLSVLERIYVGMGMSATKVDVRTDFLYVANKHQARIDAYDPFSFYPLDSIQAEKGINYMTIDDEENNLYIVLPKSRALMIVNLISKKMVAKIDVGQGPYWVNLMRER